MINTTAFVGVCALALVAPFEVRQPILRLPWQSVSNVEAVLAGVSGVWLASLVWSRRWPRWQTPLTGPWLLLLAVMFVAAAAAPSARVNALHMAARLTIGFGVFLLTINGITTPARLHRAMTAALVSGVAVGVLAILEYFRVGLVLDWLRAFRPGLAVVGAQVRAGGPLQYPTIASMYLEIVFAFGLGLLLQSLDANRSAVAGATFIGLAVMADAIMLTFTRTGLATMALGLALVGAVRYAGHGADRGFQWLGALAVVILVLFASSRAAQAVWLRLTSEGQDAWYRASVDAPAELMLTTGASATVPVIVKNLGRLTWASTDDPPFYLSYHWLTADGERVVSFDGARSTFASPVSTGESVWLDAGIRAPRQPGRYRLEWDVVQESRLWFNTEPGAAAAVYSDATVTGPSLTGGGPTPTTPRPRRAVRPGRLVLWGAAARMFAAHPILGVGPDNFRLQYGQYAGLANPDLRIHSNNMYIEMIVGGGLPGGLAFLWLIWRAAGRCIAAVARAADPRYVCAVGVGAAGAAVFVHGAVDSFLGFTPTYIVIALTLGLAAACTRAPGTVTDADRI
jgi:hypothetical protein